MPRRDARGAVTLLVVALAGLLLLLGSALGVVAALVVAHRTAQAAADLAAIAGATALQRGRDPCATAADVAAGNGASLTACAVIDRDVLVDVSVTGPRWLGQDADLHGRARAGPARAGPASVGRQ
ncbi:Rv3654c family TadE-like protein [Nocardioides sp.]|uniref:Rv3654c family TadE-like protein n=1 Tax=Nocardioides sp. TaxID=35761 RepID=UPI00286AF7F6|nr:Rv3654c family TadE-like protein [Nocardioides sp.]